MLSGAPLIRSERTSPLLLHGPQMKAEILRIHSAEHFLSLRRACERGPGQLDPDTYVSSKSFEVALLAAGGAIDLARSVVRGESCSGIAIVRPPGHHAEAEQAMGFLPFQ